MARPDSSRVNWRRDVGVAAARRLKDILRGSPAPARPLPPSPPPPVLEERRSLERRPLGLSRFRRPPDDDDDRDE